MKVRFKKLHQDATIPSYAKPGDAGMDLTCIDRYYDQTTNCWVYLTGLAMEIPPGYVGLIFPRSSICKVDLSLSNAVGVIDSGYRGEIKFFFRGHPRDNQLTKLYAVGDRIGQLMILPFPMIDIEEVRDLSESERGTGGFGSSGN